MISVREEKSEGLFAIMRSKRRKVFCHFVSKLCKKAQLSENSYAFGNRNSGNVRAITLDASDKLYLFRKRRKY
jgi:hypothetical protein